MTAPGLGVGLAFALPPLAPSIRYAAPPPPPSSSTAASRMMISFFFDFFGAAASPVISGLSDIAQPLVLGDGYLAAAGSRARSSGGRVDSTTMSTRRFMVTERGSLGGISGRVPAKPAADIRSAAMPWPIRYRTTVLARAVDSSHALG